MNLTNTAFAVALGSLLIAPAFAVSIDTVTANPASGARVGDKVSLQVNMQDIEQGLCGLSVNFGDGKIEHFKVKPDAKLPLVFEHVYQAAGTVTIEVRGNRVENALGCSNKQKFTYTIAPAPVAAAPAVAVTSCPTDWALKGKVAKTGAFTCIPKKGVKDAKKPDQPLSCPSGTTYFTKSKTLGCEKG